MECRVLVRRVSSVDCETEVWSVECGVWSTSTECRVESVEWKVWSVKGGV